MSAGLLCRWKKPIWWWWWPEQQCKCKEACIALCYDTSSRSAQAWSVLNGFTKSYLPPTRFIPARARPCTPGNLHPQSSTAVTHCLLIATHFTDPRKDDSLCQARECHRELNLGRWRQGRVCHHTATCSLKSGWRRRETFPAAYPVIRTNKGWKAYSVSKANIR